MNHVRFMLILFSTLLLSACGGGGGGAPADPPPAAKTATLRLSSNGALTGNLAGLTITIALPPGVNPATDAGGAVQSTVVLPSGVVNNATIPVNMMLYTASTASTAGSLTFVLASNASAGFATGEFAKVTLIVSANANPENSAFVPSDFEPFDVLGRPVPDLTVAVSSTIQ